jgi:phosphatidylglycerol:prolipoprotein diacylglycerol transferase
MRPILVELPSKALFVLALVLAVVTAVREYLARRKDPKAPKPQGWITFAIGAWALLAFRGDSYLPTPAALAAPWKSVPIFSYGVMLGTAMVVGWFLAMRLAKNDGIPQEIAGNIYMWTAVWSIVGARILYVIANPSEFVEEPSRIFKIWQGGLVAYGGMIGGFLTSWYNCWRRKIPLLQWADASAPSVVLGTGITRVGCLLFGCDYGKRTDLPWALHFPKGSPAWRDHVENFHLASDASASFGIHPTQVYEMLAALFVFGLCMLTRRLRKFSGLVFVVWVVGYGILRPIIEIYRDDDQRGGIGGLSTSQIIGITASVFGLGLLVKLLKRYKQNPEGLRLWEHPILVPAEAAAGAGQGASSASPRKRRAR